MVEPDDEKRLPLFDEARFKDAKEPRAVRNGKFKFVPLTP